MKIISSANKSYLGDGVYAAWDGNGVELTTERVLDGNTRTDMIYLEIETYELLQAFTRKLLVPRNE